MLKQAGFAKLCFLSFYKEFEEIMETRPIPELQKLHESYKLNSINLNMDKAEELVPQNQVLTEETQKILDSYHEYHQQNLENPHMKSIEIINIAPTSHSSSNSNNQIY